eukprot:TRINITY_DN74810_c0_g1_i1.p1 TRINITY_DN74810_c0_g1~~TRINITY_DN74810_c0_g1_i1.p1  ORF type:complete len:750 (+),score=113.44 TRINITY_DN74810_c0_g1_i1:61-2250(+)
MYGHGPPRAHAGFVPGQPPYVPGAHLAPQPCAHGPHYGASSGTYRTGQAMQPCAGAFVPGQPVVHSRSSGSQLPSSQFAPGGQPQGGLPDYSGVPPSEEENESAIRALLSNSIPPGTPRHGVARAGLVSGMPEPLRRALALVHAGRGVDVARLRAEHVPPAPIGIRVEADGKRVKLDPGELRDFREAPAAVEVWALPDQIDTIMFRYPSGAHLTGFDGNPVGRWGGMRQAPFMLQQFEFITKLSGWATGMDSKAALASVRFHTSRGRVSPDYGRQQPPPNGQPFEFRAPSGTVMAAFSRLEGSVACPRLEEAIFIAHPSSQDLVSTGEDQLRQLLNLPADWNIAAFCQGKRLEGAQGGRASSGSVKMQNMPEMVHAMQGLFDGTFRKIHTRDRRGAPIADLFRVLSVYRVLNDQVWREYKGHREKIRLLRWNCAGLEQQIPGGPDTHAYLQRHGRERDPRNQLPELDAQVGECWLFHGTSFEAAKGIAENDFSLDLSGSNAGTLYGKGIYLAENVTKSDEYGEGPRGRAGEEERPGNDVRPPPGPIPELRRHSAMIVCRSLLGKVRYSDERSPNPDALQQSCRGQAPAFDSVLGDRRKVNGTFREFVLYNDDQVYPEFVVVYERLFFHERFQAIFDAMVDRCRRRQFHGPTSEEEAVLKSLWDRYAMPNNGKIDKWQLLDLLKAINQPPQDEAGDLDETFKEINTSGSGRIQWDEFRAEMVDRVQNCCR